MKKSLLLFLMSLYSPLFLFAEVGDTFTAKTTEGYDMVFTILDETEMTCQVGYLDGASNKLAVDKDVINGTVTIPNIVTPLGSDDGYLVNKIGKYAFYGCSNITSIIIPDAVEAIDDYALAECINLGLVIIEVEGPIDITAEVFANSDRFNAALHVPVACKEDYAAAPIWKEFGMILEGNEGSTFTAKTAEDVEMVFTILDEIEMTCQVGYLDGASNKPAVNRDVVEGAVTIPGSVNGYTVVKIGKYAFDNTVKMTSVTIPTTVTSINNNAFFNCNGLTSFELPASVTNIGKSALVSLRSVTSLKVAEGNTVYDSRGDCNAIIETATNKLLFGSKITTIPADVSEIGEYSFAYLDNYTFTIPSTVTKIDDNAFSFCANWTLQVEHTTPLEISENVFGDMNNTTTLRVPSGSKDAYAAATGWKNFGIIEEPATLTAKSYSRAYGEDNPTFDYDATGGTITGTPEITCEATTTSDVGTYDIIISKGTITNNDVTYVNGTLTITSKTVSSPTITLSETSYTYDESAKEPTVTVKDGETTISSDEYTVSYSNNTNVGTATVTITDKEGGNYIVSGSTTFAISAADGSLTAPTGNTGLVYTGDAQDLITAGSTTTGTLQYSLDGTNYGTTIPQGTDAKEYTVYYRVEGDDNHNDIPATSLNVSIAAKTVSSPTITLSETSYTYDGSAKEPTVTVKDGETTISSDEYTVSYSNNTNVGTATVTITDKEGGNYIVSGSTTFTISAADGSLTPPTGNTGLVYTGDAQDLITAGSTTTGTLQYSLDGTNYGTTIPQGTDANEYTVYYRVEGDDNHNDVAATSFKVTIAKAPLKITAKNYTRKQGEANPEFGVTYEGFKNNETDAVLTTKPTITCAATESSEAGTYDIVVSGASAANYEISYVAGTLTVEAITPPTPMPEPKGTIFDVNLDESASKEVNITFVVKEMDHSGTPTVAISDDKDASGSVSIPEAVTHNGVEYKVTEISEGAFQNNTSLTEVKIPASITSIGAKAFAGCKNLQEITINIIVPINIAVISARGLTRTESSSSVFEGVDMETCILYVPEGSVDAYKAAPGWKDFKNIVVIGTATGIKGTEMAEGETFDVFNLNGLKVKSQATSLDGLPRGIYIINGKKVMK